MTTVTYTGYPQVGEVLTSEHIGKNILRTYPYITHIGKLSFDCMICDSFPSVSYPVTAVDINCERGCVKVKGKWEGDFWLPNDSHWLLHDDFETKIKSAVKEVFSFQAEMLPEVIAHLLNNI